MIMLSTRSVSDATLVELPSQVAVKSVQGVTQAREDVRLELNRGRKMSVVRRVSGHQSMPYNKVAPTEKDKVFTLLSRQMLC